VFWDYNCSFAIFLIICMTISTSSGILLPNKDIRNVNKWWWWHSHIGYCTVICDHVYYAWMAGGHFICKAVRWLHAGRYMMTVQYQELHIYRELYLYENISKPNILFSLLVITKHTQVIHLKSCGHCSGHTV
jgi:hypothetical protein